MHAPLLEHFEEHPCGERLEAFVGYHWEIKELHERIRVIIGL